MAFIKSLALFILVFFTHEEDGAMLKCWTIILKYIDSGEDIMFYTLDVDVSDDYHLLLLLYRMRWEAKMGKSKNWKN